MGTNTKVILILISIFILLSLIWILTSTLILKKYDKQVSKKLYAVNILLAQKYDILILLAKLFKKYKIVIPSEFIDELSPAMNENLKLLTITEKLTVQSYLLKASQTIFYYAEQNEELKKETEYLTLKKTLIDLDKDYRKATALYNADVIGINYWSHTFLFAVARKILHLVDREIIK